MEPREQLASLASLAVGQKKQQPAKTSGFSSSYFGFGGKKTDYKNPKIFSTIDFSN